MGRNEGKNGMDKIESILNEMSLEDKIALCSGANFWETKKMEPCSCATVPTACASRKTARICWE